MGAQQVKHASSTGTQRTGRGVLTGFILTAGPSADATLKLYNNTAASGTVLGSVAAVQGTSVVVTGLCVPFGTGVHAVLSGTGAEVTVYME